jgi:hypothetical protein
MNENRVSAKVSTEDVTAVKGAVETIHQKLPFLIGLDAETRRAMPRMGDKSRAFVRKCLELANQNPAILPRGFDLEEFNRDVALDEAMLPIAQLIGQLAEMVDDTQTAVRSDVYLAALIVYRSAKLAGKGTGLDGVIDDLARRFMHKSGNPAAVTPTTSTAK